MSVGCSWNTIAPTCRSVIAANARSRSLARPASIISKMIFNAFAVVSISLRTRSFEALFGLRRIAAFVKGGIASFTSSSRLAVKLGIEEGQSGDVASRARKARNQDSRRAYRLPR